MPSEFDISQSAASVYADSLLELANEQNQAEEIGRELDDLKSLWRLEPSFASMMRSPAIDEDARRESLKRIFEGKASPLVLNLLLVLNDHHRAMILPHVCEAYRAKLDVQLKRQETHVTTAVKLTDAQRDRLRREVQRLTGKQPILIEKVDPELLGGMTVQVADRIYDTSVRRRLREMRTDLLAAFDHHLRQDTARFVTQG